MSVILLTSFTDVFDLNKPCLSKRCITFLLSLTTQSYRLEIRVKGVIRLEMLDLYLLGQNCLNLTFKPYLSSETYSRKYEKLPNIVVHACKILQK